jgi:hypothetical protein
MVNSGFSVALGVLSFKVLALALNGKKATRLTCTKHATKTSLENCLIILFMLLDNSVLDNCFPSFYCRLSFGGGLTFTALEVTMSQIPVIKHL